MTNIHTSIDLNALDSPQQLRKVYEEQQPDEDIVSKLKPSSMHVVGFVLSEQPPTGPMRTFKLNSYDLLPTNAEGSESNLNVAILVTYITGLFFFLPHIASIALSLRSIKTGQVQTHRSKIIVFSFLELAAWVSAISLGWGYSVQWPYTGKLVYWGWVVIAVWWVTALVFGLLRVIYSWRMLPRATSYIETTNNERHLRGLKIATLVTYIAGVVTFIPHLASIIVTLVMIKKGYITKNLNSVMAFCVLEFVGLMVAAALSWAFFPECSAYDYRCDSMFWFGWIFICLWGVFALAFGIPRVIFVWRQNLVKPSKDFKVSPYGVAMA